ncbi:hypothetical protein BRD13_05085 [Halobacteriales archaeon SW_5_70_135]|nr:MAG: hypothetical protein BRD13_05085 [Halobacteriales archaeon SW_5_70_135]
MIDRTNVVPGRVTHHADDERSVGRLMPVDRSSILVSSLVSSDIEHATYGTGFGDGLVVVSR